ncbi:phage tail assembly protein [Neisseria sp. Dent CA1/247]|uniref:Phage tail protein n=1 Tax=Neisseria dumasiana TaxID=1931275 RepID=A0A1X3DHX7_9NEIS|nr:MULTISPECIES: phage tail assembly protein [Neisseria]OSI20403.1 hypothetical protein BV912_07480 [Neisseria dumasiana]UOO76041.1 phage tail assembly protein [Neisseria sp. Dent CA1/247]
MRTQVVTLKHGFKVAGEYLKDVVLREPRVSDMIQAENLVPNGGNIAFRTALLATCIDKVDGSDLPVTVAMIGELKLGDYNILVEAFGQLEAEGEDEAKKE